MLPNMIKNNYGRILNVGSIGSFIPTPTDAVYSATKAYLASFSAGLNGELSETNVKIMLLCQGATKTEFAVKANIQDILLFKIWVMKPDQVVDIAYLKLLKGKCIVIPGTYNKLNVMLATILPGKLRNYIIKRIMYR